MKRVVVTGLGIVSSIGNNAAEVTQSFDPYPVCRLALFTINRPSSSVSAILRELSSGVAESPVVPTTRIGPAPLPVILMR